MPGFGGLLGVVLDDFLGDALTIVEKRTKN